MAYVVHNLTKRTIILSDLRAEIGPHKMLDLEKVAERAKVERSYDLRSALNTGRLRLISHGVVSETKPQPKIKIVEVEKIIEKHHHHKTIDTGIDEAKIAEVMRQILKEEQAKQKPQTSNTEDMAQILAAMSQLHEKIEAINIGAGVAPTNVDEISIDPVRLAELKALAIKKISADIETGNVKTGKKVTLKGTRLSDLADELD